MAFFDNNGFRLIYFVGMKRTSSIIHIHNIIMWKGSWKETVAIYKYTKKYNTRGLTLFIYYDGI